MKSIFEAFSVKLSYEREISSNTDILLAISSISQQMSSGGIIIALLDGDKPDNLFSKLHSYFTDKYGTSKEISEHYTVYLFGTDKAFYNSQYAEDRKSVV